MRFLSWIVAGILKLKGSRRLPTASPSAGPVPGAALPEASSFTIHAGWLIDGSGGPIRRNVQIEIRNGLIHGPGHGQVHVAVDQAGHDGAAAEIKVRLRSGRRSLG